MHSRIQGRYAAGEPTAAIQNGHYRSACSIAHSLPTSTVKDAPSLTLMASKQDSSRYERLARRWLEKFIDKDEPDFSEVTSAAELLRDLKPGHSRQSMRRSSRCDGQKLARHIGLLGILWRLRSLSAGPRGTIALNLPTDRTVQAVRGSASPDVIETFPYENENPASEPVDLTLVC